MEKDLLREYPDPDLKEPPADLMKRVQVVKRRACEDKYMTPFREAWKARLQKELKGIQFLTVPGTHADSVFTSRDQVAEAMTQFLTASQP